MEHKDYCRFSTVTSPRQILAHFTLEENHLQTTATVIIRMFNPRKLILTFFQWDCFLVAHLFWDRASLKLHKRRGPTKMSILYE